MNAQTQPRTAAEKYMTARMSDPQYARAYRRARRRIAVIDFFARLVGMRAR